MLGYEFEFIVREGDAPLSKDSFLAFHKKLAKLGWQPEYDPGTGGLVGSKNDKFKIKTDDGVGVMELNTPPHETLYECDEEMRKLLKQLQDIYKKLGCAIVGVSTQPGYFDLSTKDCHDYCVNDQCCNKSFIKHINPRRWHQAHHGLFLIAAHQVWLDAEKEDLMRQRNILERASGPLMALFANGPIFANKKLENLEGRDIFWRQMLSQGNDHNDEKYFSLPPTEPQTIIEYFDFIFTMPFFVSFREGKSYSLVDKNKTYKDFFSAPETAAEMYNLEKFTTKPEVIDFFELQHSTFPNVRVKYKIKTGVTLKQILTAYKTKDSGKLFDYFSQVFMECRVISAQSEADLSAGPALLLGLQENIAELEKITKSQPYEFWQGMYQAVLKDGLKTIYQGKKIIELVKEMIKIAEQGLKKRGQSEEKFLQPLYERCEKKQNPAEELINLWQKEGLPGIYQARDFS